MIARRRLHVLSAYPGLGSPGDTRDAFEGAQAYVDQGYAEWIVERGNESDDSDVETTDRPAPPEVAVKRTTKRAVKKAAPPIERR